MINVTKAQFQLLLDSGYTNDQLAGHFSCSVNSVKAFKRANNLVGYKTNSKPLSISELNTISAYIDKGTALNKVAELIGISSYRLEKYLPKSMYSNLVMNSREALSNNHRIGSLKNFLEPSSLTAYMVGYFQADGCLTSDGYVTIGSIDKDLVRQVAQYMGSNITSRERPGYDTFFTTKVKDVRNIEKFKEVTGILPKKTYTGYEIPDWIKLDVDFMENFIVGVFNGDGSVAAKRPKHPQLQVEQHTSQLEFLKTINAHLNWSVYNYTYAKIQTSSRDKCSRFLDLYGNNENALVRKVEKLEFLLDN
jgi:hypothetical protein